MASRLTLEIRQKALIDQIDKLDDQIEMLNYELESIKEQLETCNQSELVATIQKTTQPTIWLLPRLFENELDDLLIQLGDQFLKYEPDPEVYYDMIKVEGRAYDKENLRDLNDNLEFNLDWTESELDQLPIWSYEDSKTEKISFQEIISNQQYQKYILDWANLKYEWNREQVEYNDWDDPAHLEDKIKHYPIMIINRQYLEITKSS